MRSTGPARMAPIVFSLLLSGLCFWALVTLLEKGTQAALLPNPTSGPAPEIRSITITSDLPFYDPTGGEGISNGRPLSATVFFRNLSAGTISLTFEISGTPPLTLTAGAAFGDPAQTFTSTTVPWLQKVVYSVEPDDRDHVGVAYTVISTDARHSVAITYVRDIDPPTGVMVSAPDHTAQREFLVSWSARDAASGVASYTLEYSGTVYSDWQPWLTNMTATAATFFAPNTEIDYIFSATAYDHVGNSAYARTRTFVGLWRFYLPLVERTHRLFLNGDFEDGLTGWTTEQGPFDGNGSGLAPQVVLFDGGQRALLGKLGASNGTIPVGYGTIRRTFMLDKRYVRLQYWVFSHDKAKGAQRYWDTFEVSVNRAPGQVSDQERDARGCASESGLNPEGTVVLSGDGLAFCAGWPGASGGTLWDTGGWKSVTLDLRTFRGKTITLYFTIWSREYASPSCDDQAWYNTWAYVDNVQPID